MLSTFDVTKDKQRQFSLRSLIFSELCWKTFVCVIENSRHDSSANQDHRRVQRCATTPLCASYLNPNVTRNVHDCFGLAESDDRAGFASHNSVKSMWHCNVLHSVTSLRNRGGETSGRGSVLGVGEIPVCAAGSVPLL